MIFQTTLQNILLVQYRHIGLDHLNFKHMAPPENKNFRGSDYLWRAVPVLTKNQTRETIHINLPPSGATKTDPTNVRVTRFTVHPTL